MDGAAEDFAYSDPYHIGSREQLNQDVTEAATITAKMLTGIDVDENGLVEPLPGEAGVQVAYEQAYRMADMPSRQWGFQTLEQAHPPSCSSLPRNPAW